MKGFSDPASTTMMVLLGVEAFVQWILRRGKPLRAWRRKNGRRWVVDDPR